MECPSCHTENSSNAKVCRQCGYSFSQAQSPASNPQASGAQGPIAGFRSFSGSPGAVPPGGYQAPPQQNSQPGQTPYRQPANSYNQPYGQQPPQGYQQQPGYYSQSTPPPAQTNYPPYQQNPQYQNAYRAPDPNPPMGGYIKCPNCGALSSLSNPNCAHCGMPLSGMGYLSSKDKTTALLLCIFLGAIGGHMFYVNKTGMGILYLFTGGLLGIGVIIDLINIINGTFTDSDGLRLRQN